MLKSEDVVFIDKKQANAFLVFTHKGNLLGATNQRAAWRALNDFKSILTPSELKDVMHVWVDSTKNKDSEQFYLTMKTIMNRFLVK